MTRRYRFPMLLALGILAVITTLSVLVYGQAGQGGDDVAGSSAQVEVEQLQESTTFEKTMPVESQEQRIARMLRQFDQTPYSQGVVLVSFLQEVSKSDASLIIRKFGLDTAPEARCVVPEEANEPEGADVIQEPIERPSAKCIDSESWWNDRLKLAKVIVPGGQEKVYAQKLIENENILWVEPERISTIAGNGQTYGVNVGETGKETKSTPIYKILLGILLVLVFFYIIFRKKK